MTSIGNIAFSIEKLDLSYLWSLSLSITTSVFAVSCDSIDSIYFNEKIPKRTPGAIPIPSLVDDILETMAPSSNKRADVVSPKLALVNARQKQSYGNYGVSYDSRVISSIGHDRRRIPLDILLKEKTPHEKVTDNKSSNSKVTSSRTGVSSLAAMSGASAPKAIDAAHCANGGARSLKQEVGNALNSKTGLNAKHDIKCCRLQTITPAGQTVSNDATPSGWHSAKKRPNCGIEKNSSMTSSSKNPKYMQHFDDAKSHKMVVRASESSRSRSLSSNIVQQSKSNNSTALRMVPADSICQEERAKTVAFTLPTNLSNQISAAVVSSTSTAFQSKSSSTNKKRKSSHHHNDIIKSNDEPLSSIDLLTSTNTTRTKTSSNHLLTSMKIIQTIANTLNGVAIHYRAAYHKGDQPFTGENFKLGKNRSYQETTKLIQPGELIIQMHYTNNNGPVKVSVLPDLVEPEVSQHVLSDLVPVHLA